jgi:hypothetical protein
MIKRMLLIHNKLTTVSVFSFLLTKAVVISVDGYKSMKLASFHGFNFIWC